MKQSIIIFILIIAGHTYLSAQNEGSKQWSFSLSGGAAIPVGTYGKNDAANAAIYRTDVQNPIIIGFDKTKSGFAKVGYYYNAELQFKLNRGIFFFLRSGQLTNTVQKDVLSDFLTELNKGEVKVEHVDYNVLYITPGVGYHKNFGEFGLGLSVFAGYANCNYPYYKAILLFTTTDPPIMWAHEGKKPALNTLTIGSLLHLDYKISPKFLMGLELMYQKADFKYKMSTRSIPGGSPNPEINDTVKFAVVNLGFKVGYMF